MASAWLWRVLRASTGSTTPLRNHLGLLRSHHGLHGPCICQTARFGESCYLGLPGKQNTCCPLYFFAFDHTGTTKQIPHLRVLNGYDLTVVGCRSIALAYPVLLFVVLCITL